MTLSKTDPYLSIVIPVFNEEDRIKNLNQVWKFFSSQKYSFELVIVDDGSSDQTRKLVTKFGKKHKIVFVFYTPNFGKGYAIKKGVLASSGKYILFTDIDLSTPLKHTVFGLANVKKCDVVVGSRKGVYTKIIRRQSVIRENLGKGFTWLSQFILGMQISDFTCGFKFFSRPAALLIFPNLTINRWGFDSEILFLAKKRKLDIRELSVTWKNDPRTKVKFPQDIFRSLADLIRIRVNDLFGAYR